MTPSAQLLGCASPEISWQPSLDYNCDQLDQLHATLLTLLKIHPGKIACFFLIAHNYGFLYGIIFGYLTGTIIDRTLAHFRRKRVENLLFLALGKLARADGKIRKEEIDRAETIFRQLGISGKRRQQAIDHFRMGALPDFDLYSELESFQKKGVPITQRFALLEMLVIFSIEKKGDYAELSRHYLRILMKIAEILEIREVQLKTLIQLLVAQANFQHFADADPMGGDSAGNGAGEGYGYYENNPFGSGGLALAYQALGASKSESDEQIKKKYRRLLGKYHPDKIVGQGFGDDAVKLANEKTQQLKAAYEQIKRSRGIK